MNSLRQLSRAVSDPPVYTTAPTSNGRNLQIDVLRAMAVLGVIARHAVLFRPADHFDALPMRAGWAGVDLFFVLSGFLISGLLFGEYRRFGRIRFRRFAVRRALKIYPPLYALILLTLADRLRRGQYRSWADIWYPLRSDLLFLQSYLPGTWGHFWSLAVEEHFYVLLPLTLYFLLRRSRPDNPDPFRLLPRFFAVVAVVLLLLRLWTAQYVVPFSWQTHLFPTHLRIDSLLFGVVLSYWSHFHAEIFAKRARKYYALIVLAAVVLISPCFLLDQYAPWMYTYGYVSMYAGFGAALVSLLYLPMHLVPHWIIRGSGWLAYVGTFSYSIYLWHIPWLDFLGRKHLLQVPRWGVALYWMGSIVIGIAAAKLVEVPSLRLRQRLFPGMPVRIVQEPTLDRAVQLA